MADIDSPRDNKLSNHDVQETADPETSLMVVAEEMLADARSEVLCKQSFNMPIAQLATLGVGVSSLLPQLRTVTQTTSFNTSGLFRLANATVGDTLKIAKGGNYWGAFKTAKGSSKLAKLQSAGPISASSQTVMPINPATVMMAIALSSIEKELGKISEMEQQILSFLAIEKESEIEADVETLTNLISNYKLNWDNDLFVASNHKLVCDIQRTARKNMNAYQKQVAEIIEAKKFIVPQAKIQSTLADLQKKFKYYRLSLYTFSMASFTEIMLSGNFKEEYISGIKSEIEKMSVTYRNVFEKCSAHLEKMGNISLEANVLKGIGTAGKTVSKWIGNIPLAKERKVDALLLDGSSHLNDSALEMERSAVESFGKIADPSTRIFIDKMDDMIQIYNHTSQICFDDQNIYLIAG